jgi:hypothetical protein
MAINLGNAYVTVNAVTSGFREQLRRGIDAGGDDGDRAGERVGRRFSEGFSRGSGGSGSGMFNARFFREADQARERFQTLLRTGYVLGPLLTALGGIVGSLGTALFAMGAAAAVASQALIVLPASLLALAQAAVVAKVAMIGVGEAIKAGLKPASGAAKDTKTLQNALERLEDARRRLAQAEEDRAEAIENANRRIVDAEENYIDAQYESEKAAQRLSRARKEAAEDLKQLRFETEGAAISEQRARLQFERSRESLQRVQDLPPNSRARREAELAFAEADLNLRKSIDRNATLKQTEKEATAAGVDGSEKVLNASEALAKAKKREADAYRGVQDAAIAAAKAQRDANRRVEDAERALARAKEDVADASKKAKTGIDQFGEAMKKLSPEAQEFVRYIISIKDEFNELKAAAGKELFPRLILAIDNLVKNLLPRLIPLFRETGKVLGEAATSFSDTVTEARNLERLERIWKTNDTLLGNFSGALNNLYEVFLILLDAAEPLIIRFGEWIETLTAGWKESLNAEGATERLTEKFNRAGDVIATLGGIFKSFGKGLGGLTGAINEPGGAIDLLLEKLDKTAKKFEAFATGPENKEGINTFFEQSITNAGILATAIGNALRAFGEIGASKDFEEFLTSINEAVLNLRDAANTFTSGGGLAAFGKLIEEFSITIKAFTEAGSITVFFGVLTEILKFINTLATSEPGKKIITTVAPVLAFFSAIGFAFKIGKFFFMAMIGTLGKALTIVSNFSRVLLILIKSPAKFLLYLKLKFAGLIKLLKPIFTLMKTMVTFIWGKFLAALTALGKAFSALGKLMMKHPIILIVIALIAIGFLIYKFRKQIMEFFEKVVAALADFANKMKEKFFDSLAKVIDFFKELPGKVMDAIKDFGTKVLDFIIKYHPLAILWRLISENWETIKAWFVGLPGKIMEAIKDFSIKVAEFIQKYHPLLILWRLVSENWEKIKGWFTGLPQRIVDSIKDLANAAGKVWSFIKRYNPMRLLFDFLIEIWPQVSQWFTDKLGSMVNWFKSLPDRITSATRNLWDGIRDSFKTALNWIINKWNGFKLEAKVPSNPFTESIGIAGKGFKLETPYIPPFAEGGVVFPKSGGTLALLAEAGKAERIEPLDKDGLSKRDRAMIQLLSGGGGGGTTINVYPSAGMNERELAEMVSRKLAFQMRRGGI